MDRALSFFGVYDVFGYLASGVSAVVGIWWLTAGSIPHLSTVGVLGLLGSGYVAGQVTATLGHFWEWGWWKWKGPKPYIAMLDDDEEEFGEPLRRELVAKIDEEVQVEGLDTRQRFNLARARLRWAGDGRAETMRAMHGLCRNLAATAGLLFFTALGALVLNGCEKRLWIALGLSFCAIFAFGWRAIRFERRFGREVWLGYLALQAELHRS
jgi:hypothetical protein